MNENILIIEDDQVGLSLLKNILTKKKFKVSGIEKTDDIYQSIEEFKPDLIITDYLLSGLNGGNICRLIKSDQKTCPIPVILISAYKDLALGGGNFGFDAFLSKPFDFTELVQTIKNCLNKGQAATDS
jgi:two-component system phosphate regulon response regulator PhoB